MKHFQTKTYALELEKDGFPERKVRLAFLSDVHNHSFGEKNQILLEKLRELEPDAVLLGGDLLIAKPNVPIEPAAFLVRQLAEQFRIYYAPGNHEYRLKLYPGVYGTMYEQYRRALSDCPIHWLENRAELLELDGVRLQIFGLELDKRFYQRFCRQELPKEELTRLLGTPDKAACSILLAHHPGYGKSYFSWGADLTLSGHFHGGVMRIGKQGVISPDVRLFPRFSYGHFKSGEKHMIVSGGLGEHTIPFRIFNPRELVMLELHFKRGKNYGNTGKTACL